MAKIPGMTLPRPENVSKRLRVWIGTKNKTNYEKKEWETKERWDYIEYTTKVGIKTGEEQKT